VKVTNDRGGITIGPWKYRYKSPIISSPYWLHDPCPANNNNVFTWESTKDYECVSCHEVIPKNIRILAKLQRFK